LTLPWKRPRKRRGRAGRIVLSLVIVMAGSLSFAGMGHALICDLALCFWLAYTMTYTYVRYGVLDQARRRSTPGRAS